jgi:hypothetical protein
LFSFTVVYHFPPSLATTNLTLYSYFAESNRLSPPAISGRPKKEKIIGKRFENEVGNGKREEGKEDGLRVLVTLRSDILGRLW